MKFFTLIALAALVFLSGCTTYHVRRADGTEMRISSSREFPEGVLIQYTSAQGADLTINAGAVTNRPSALEEFALKILGSYLNIPQAPPPLLAAPPTQETTDE